MLVLRCFILSFAFLGAFLELAQAHSSPGFDCAKAATPVEKLICSNDALATLDAQLSQKYAEAKANNPQDAAYLRQSQQQWLDRRAAVCGITPSPTDPKYPSPTDPDYKFYVDCLSNQYQERIRMLGLPVLWPPFEDKVGAFLANPPQLTNQQMIDNDTVLEQIACLASKQEPEKALTLFIKDWGRKFGRFAPVCEEEMLSHLSLAMSLLLRQYSHLSGVKSSFCGGSIVRDIDHISKLQEWQAALDIQPAESAVIDRAELRFPKSFEHWAQQGVWEREQYRKSVALRAAALSALQDYYSRRFNLDTGRARHLAIYYLNEFADIYIGRTPSAPDPDSYESGRLGVADVHAFLQASESAKIHYSLDSLDSLLKLAIVNDFSVQDIQTILNAMPTTEIPHATSPRNSAAIASMSQKIAVRETALMKAAPRPDVLALLLKSGRWNVNAQNWFGKTALMYAVQYNNLQSVKLLLANHAYANVSTLPSNAISPDDCYMNGLRARKRTVLMYAAWYATPEMISLLLRAGADPWDKDDRGGAARNYLARNSLLSAAQRSEGRWLLQSP